MCLLFALPATVAHVLRPYGLADRVVTVDSIKDALATLEHSRQACVIVPVPTAEQNALLESIVHLRRAYPNATAVACFVERVSSHRAALSLGQAGVTELLVGDPAPRQAELQVALGRCSADSVAIRVWHRAELHVPEPFVSLFKAAIRQAHAPLNTVTLAAAAGMHERTLRKYCTAHGLPSPQWIIGWARLLVAAFYLDEPGRSVAGVAELLGFPSTCALRNQLRRYSEHTMDALRRSGCSSTLARSLERAVLATTAHESASLASVRSPNAG